MTSPSTTTTDATETAAITQVYRVYIKATPQAIWDAITKPEWASRYGYGGTVQYDLRPGGKYRGLTSEEMKADARAHGGTLPDVAVDGEVIEADPPRRLVQTWRMLLDPDIAAEGFTRLTYEIDEVPGSGIKLTVTHEVTDAPKVAAMLLGGEDSEGGGGGGGWSWILSDLKSLLETGAGLRG
ncbi:MAG TPA: SRPBCC domain-containing protein [Pseudonocardiaceae bacterium]|nr:SRPBCC domain-containing protein [Pseudonocardiaceae bacterium]